jgi:hypothetical protein
MSSLPLLCICGYITSSIVYLWLHHFLYCVFVVTSLPLLCMCGYITSSIVYLWLYVVDWLVWFMVLNTTFNNILAISWRSISLVGECHALRTGSQHLISFSSWESVLFSSRSGPDPNNGPGNRNLSGWSIAHEYFPTWDVLHGEWLIGI